MLSPSDDSSTVPDVNDDDDDDDDYEDGDEESWDKMFDDDGTALSATAMEEVMQH